MAMQKVLVIGATGKTGRRLLPLLGERGVTVRAGSRTHATGPDYFDWDRQDSFGPALDGIDAIYLVPPDLVENPAAHVAALLERARAAGVRRVVALSSLGVTFSREPASSGRHQLEQVITASGLEWTLLRPSGFAQNFSEGFLLPGILQGDVVASATGNGRVPLVDAGDIARVAAAALTEDGHAGATYAITGPEALSFPEAVALINAVSNRQIRHEPLTPETFTSRLIQFGVPAEYAALIVRDQVAIHDGEASTVSDTVRAVTGTTPTSFSTYVTQAAPVWRQLATSTS